MVDKNLIQTFRTELLEVQKILDGCTFMDMVEIKNGLQEALNGLESPLQVMVMGAFSTGKSSFINALLGEPVTAVGALPTTAVITKLVYGDGKSVTVHFQDETAKSYSNEEFMRMSDENDATWAYTREKISYVERSLPLEVLKNINIIDSPGLEAKEAHTKITKKFVNHADVVFWMFSAENAGTATEIEALGTLNSRLQPIAIINKMDTLDEEEDDPEEFLQDMQHKLEGKVRSVIGISAEMAVEGKESGNSKMLQESNIGQVEQAIKIDIIPQSNELKVNTLMEHMADCISSLEDGPGDKLIEGIGQLIQYAKKEADLNNASACMLLAMVLLDECKRDDGDKDKQNHWDSMMVYLECAAENNHLLAQALLAYAYCMMENIDKAKHWADIANNLFVDEADEPEIRGIALFVLGCVEKYHGDYKKSYALYEQALEYKNYLSANQIGFAYQNGRGVKKDYTRALEYYRIAAEHDVEEAQYNLGYMYYNGLGVPKNNNEALKWIKASAERGYAVAQYSMFHIYFSDEWRDEKYEEAIKWLEKAAAQGDEDAIKELNVIRGGNKENSSGIPNNGGCLVWLTFPFGLVGFLYYWLA